MDLLEIDWMVCNGGADIWLLLPAREGKKEATWVADEQWDSHISFRCARMAHHFTHTHIFLSRDGRRVRPGNGLVFLHVSSKCLQQAALVLVPMWRGLL